MVRCIECIHCEKLLQEKEYWCTFDGWVLTEEMMNNGECDAYVKMDRNDTEE